MIFDDRGVLRRGRRRTARAALGLLLAAAFPCSAATVRGSVTLPAEPRAKEGREGVWRVENGVLPIVPRRDEPHAELVVVLEGASPDKRDPSPPGVAVELHGVQLDPRVTVVPVGTTIEFKNNDRVPHALHVVEAPSLMPPASIPAGQTRAQKFGVAGAFTLRDEEFPHVTGAIVVADGAHVARLDARGAFRVEVPEGRYTLKVFQAAALLSSQPLQVGAHGAEVAVKVALPTPPPGAAGADQQ